MWQMMIAPFTLDHNLLAISIFSTETSNRTEVLSCFSTIRISLYGIFFVMKIFKMLFCTNQATCVLRELIMDRGPNNNAQPKNFFWLKAMRNWPPILMRRGDMADHSHPLIPIKSIPLQVAPIANQAFKSDIILCCEKH